VTYFCSIGSQILYIFETHGIGQTPSSLERYLVLLRALLKKAPMPANAGFARNR